MISFQKIIGIVLAVFGIIALAISVIVFSYNMPNISQAALIFIIEVFAIYGGFRLFKT